MSIENDRFISYNDFDVNDVTVRFMTALDSKVKETLRRISADIEL